MKKLLVLALLLAGLATGAQAQSVLHRSVPGTPDKAPVAFISSAGSGNCPGAGCVAIRTENTSTLFVSITGTWVGTAQFACSNDNWSTVKPIVAHVFANGAVGTVGQITTTVNGDFAFPTLGFRECGVYMTAYTSGSPALRIDADASSYFSSTGAATSNVELGSNSPVSVSGTLTNNNDTVVLPIVGAQWATAYFKTTAYTGGGFVAEVSIDGGTNYFSSAYLKRIDAVAANPTVVAAASLSGTLATYEMPLPGNATHARIRCTSSGVSLWTLSGGAPYVPGVPVVAVLYDVTSGTNAALDTNILDFSGWAQGGLKFTFSGGVAQLYAYTIDDTGASMPYADFGVTANSTTAWGQGSQSSGAAVLPKRGRITSNAIAANTSRIRLEVRR